MGLFGSRPKWRDKNPSVRRPAVAELSDADVLMEVLRVEEDPEIARIAAARIVNLGRADLLVENVAARRIQTIPAIEATHARLQSLQKEMELEDQRRRSRTSDPETLVKVVTETGDVDLALETLARIHDQRALATVLRRCSTVRVLDAARERITDPSVLEAIVADTGFSLGERRAALERVPDVAFHESVAMDDRLPHELGRAALALLQDPAALRRVALESGNSSLRYEAIERVSDDVRAEVAMSDGDATRRWSAVDRIRDSAILERLATTASDPKVRAAAARRQQDAEGVERLSRSADPGVREAAIAKIRDPVVLRGLLEKEKHHGLRASIEARLLEDEVLVEQVRVGSMDERRRAVSRLRDRSALETIAQSDPELAREVGERLKKITDVEHRIAELEQRIERLKLSPDYRQDLEWRVSGDSQTFQAYMLTAAGRDSPLARVDNLEAEIVSLRKSLG